MEKMGSGIENTDIGLMLLTALGSFLLGVFLCALFLKARRTAEFPPNVSSEPEEEVDDPTAPITPLVEMARSPHDRHRDLTVGNAVVKNLELLELILKSGERQSREEILRQVGLMTRDLHALLSSCSFQPFDYPPGTVVDGVMRLRIKIVEGKTGDGPTKIARTLKSGLVYDSGAGEEAVVIRKAEVEVF